MYLQPFRIGLYHVLIFLYVGGAECLLLTVIAYVLNLTLHDGLIDPTWLEHVRGINLCTSACIGGYNYL